MEKILVNVYVPNIEKKYDILIPINMPVKKMIELFQKAIREISLGGYEIKETSVLYNKSNNQFINYDYIIRDCGIKNGSELILI